MVDDIVKEGQALLAYEKARYLIAEAEVLAEQDLRGALGMLREVLQIAPDYPELEDEIYLREDAIEKLDDVLQHIVSQLEKGKTYRAFQLLQELPENYIILEKADTIRQLTEKVDRVESLIEEARNLPRSGTSRALPLLEEAYGLMPDYPGLEEDLDALSKSQQHYNNYISGVEAAVSAGDLIKARDLLDKFKGVYPEDESLGRLEVLIRNKEKEIKKRKEVKKSLIKIASVVFGVLVVIAVYTAFELTRVGSAEKKWASLQEHLAAKDYVKVRESGEAVQKKLRSVRFFSLEKKAELLDKVDEVLSSDEVIQGAQGNIFFDGSYIPKESMAAVQEARKILKSAEEYKVGGEYSASITRYHDALKLIEDIDAELAAQIGKNIENAIGNVQLQHVKSILNAGDDLFGKELYEEAMAEFTNAGAIADEYGFSPLDSMRRQINKRIEETRIARLDDMVRQGDNRRKNGELNAAIAIYDKALEYARINKLDSPVALKQIHEMNNRARIEEILARGDKNYSTSQWLDAIRDYTEAIQQAEALGLLHMSALERAATNIKLAEKQITLEELKRMALVAGKKFSEEKWLEASGFYKELLEIADKSGLSETEELASILDTSHANIQTAEERIYVDSKKEYLLRKYRGIMKKAFPEAGNKTFLNPEVVLLTSDENLMTFNLTAKSYVKKGGEQGRYSSYEVQYVYDRKRDSWTLVDKSSISQEGGR